MGAWFVEYGGADFHGRTARSRVLREGPVLDGGLRRRLHYSFFGPRAKKRQRRRLRPPNPRRRELRACPLNCAQSCHQFNGRSCISQTKWGVWGAKRASPSGRRPAGGQRAKPTIENKALRVVPLLGHGANVQIKACAFNSPRAQIKGLARDSFAHNSPDLRAKHRLAIQGTLLQ